MKFNVIYILAFTSVFFISCPQDPVEPSSTVDTTPPSIIKRIPDITQTENKISDPIEILFSESLDPMSVNATSIFVTDDKGLLLPSKVYYQNAEKKVSIETEFNAPITIKVNISSKVTDVAKNNFSGVSFSIKYAEWLHLDTHLLASPDIMAKGSLAFSDKNLPLLMYFAFNQRELIVKTFDGSQWNNLGTPLTTDLSYEYSFSNLKILKNAKNDIFATWVQTNRLNFDRVFRIMKYEGASWTELPQLKNVKGMLDVRTVVDSLGKFYVTLYDFDRLIWVKYLDSNIWNSLSITAINFDLPIISPGSPKTYRVENLTLGLANDLPVLAWSDGYPELIRVKAWDGTSWSLLGTSPSRSIGGSFSPSLAFKEGRLITAWVEKDTTTSRFNLFSKEWSGSSWNLLGDMLNMDGEGGDPTVFFSPIDKDPEIVFWQVIGGKLKISMQKFTGKWINQYSSNPYGNGSFDNLIKEQPFTDSNGKKYFLGIDIFGIYVSYPNLR
jgi:Bacterial Ig-like domain